MFTFICHISGSFYVYLVIWSKRLLFILLILMIHTCEPSGGSIFLPILRVPSVPPVNFQNLPPVKKIKYKKILTYILRSIFLEIPVWNSRADEKRREIQMVKVNVIFNDIRLLICLTPLQVNWVMMIIQQLSTDWQLIGDKEVCLWHTLRWLEVW